MYGSGLCCNSCTDQGFSSNVSIFHFEKLGSARYSCGAIILSDSFQSFPTAGLIEKLLSIWLPVSLIRQDTSQFQLVVSAFHRTLSRQIISLISCFTLQTNKVTTIIWIIQLNSNPCLIMVVDGIENGLK